MYQKLLTISMSAFLIYGLSNIVSVNRIISLNNVNQLIFVLVKCCVLFHERAEFLDII
jgi:hypothetical protein